MPVRKQRHEPNRTELNSANAISARKLPFLLAICWWVFVFTLSPCRYFFFRSAFFSHILFCAVYYVHVVARIQKHHNRIIEKYTVFFFLVLFRVAAYERTERDAIQTEWIFFVPYWNFIHLKHFSSATPLMVMLARSIFRLYCHNYFTSAFFQFPFFSAKTNPIQ